MLRIGSPQNVLVCDDERHIVRLIEVNLRRQNHRVRTAFSGEDALAQMRLDKPDLLVLDADMPGMSGYDVMRAMRDDPQLQDVKVVLLERTGAGAPPGEPAPDSRVSKPLDPSDIFK